MRNGKGISVFTVAAMMPCVAAAQLFPGDFCQSSLAQASKASSHRVNNNKANENKANENNAKDNKVKNNQTTSKTDAYSKASKISERKDIDWRKQLDEADKLNVRCQFSQAESILTRILPVAKKENPNGFELGVCLFRCAYSYVGQEKYQQALSALAEAQKIVQKSPETLRQRNLMFQILRTTALAYLRLNQFDKGEKFARKAIAYRIAFPEICSADFFKSTYRMLILCLEKQQKADDAKMITEIMNTIS